MGKKFKLKKKMFYSAEQAALNQLEAISNEKKRAISDKRTACCLDFKVTREIKAEKIRK